MFTPEKSKTCTRIIKEVFYPKKTNPKSFETWTLGQLIIPTLCPSSDDSCGIIEISYNLILKVGSSVSLLSNLEVPITIGTIPLKQDSNSITQSIAQYKQEISFSNDSNNNINSLQTQSDLIKPYYPVYKEYA